MGIDLSLRGPLTTEEEFHAFLDLSKLKIEIGNKWPSTKALQDAIRLKHRGKAVEAFLDKNPINRLDGTPIRDVDEFGQCLIALDEEAFTMLNEATADEHEIQHLLDLAGSPAGHYLLMFFFQEMMGDVHWLNQLARCDSVSLPLKRWLGSPQVGAGYREYIALRELQRELLGSMIGQRPVRPGADLLASEKSTSSSTWYKPDSCAYHLPHALLFRSSLTPMLVPVNYKSIMECKALLKQLSLIATYLSPNLAGMFLIHLINHARTSYPYLAPLIPYLHRIGLSEENPVLKELTFEAASIGGSDEANIWARFWSLKLAIDYEALYDLCDWALVGDFSNFTEAHSFEEQQASYGKAEPGCRFAKAMDETLARSFPEGDDESWSRRLGTPEECRSIDMAAIKAAIRQLKSLEADLPRRNVAPFVLFRFQVIEHTVISLLERRLRSDGRLCQSTSGFVDMANISRDVSILIRRDGIVLLATQPGESELCLANADAPAYFSHILEDLLERGQITCPHTDCADRLACVGKLLPGSDSCVFGQYVHELLGDVRFLASAG